MMGGRRTIALFVVLAIAAVGGSSRAVTSAPAARGHCPTGANDRPPPRTISKIQALQFQLIRRSSFNNFDGVRVARDLMRHRRLWCGVIMDRLGNDALIKLRDIGSNEWNVDTLYVLSSRVDDRALAALARRWQADALQWVGGSAADDLLGEAGVVPHRRILEVWWD
jgi:hypothetical protein